MNYKKVIRHLFTWLVTIIILAIIFSHIKFSEVIKNLAEIDIIMFSSAIILTLFAYIFIGPLRYNEFLRAVGCKISISETAILLLGSIPIRSLLPFKTGELTRIAYLKKIHNLSYFKGFLTIFLQHIFAFFVLIIFILFGWFFHNLSISQNIYITVLPLLVLFLTIFSISKIEYPAGIFKKLFSFFKKDNINNNNLPEGASSKNIIPVILYTFIIQICLIANIFLVFKAFGLEIPFSVFILFAPLTIIAATLPITVRGVGTRESAILLFFSQYAPSEKLLGCGLLLSIVNAFLPVLIGLIFMKPFLDRFLAQEKKPHN